MAAQDEALLQLVGLHLLDFLGFRDLLPIAIIVRSSPPRQPKTCRRENRLGLAETSPKGSVGARLSPKGFGGMKC
eukprot:COSAG02_NODE_13116_length_1444_cov_1.808178_1_plen_74_part_10